MTEGPRQDVAFVTQVRAALAGQVRSIVAEAAGDTCRHLQHRQLAERIKALVAADRGGGDPGLLEHAARFAVRLQELQGPSGLFAGGDNVDSPPDSAFSVNDLADALLMLRRADDTPDHDPGRLAGLLDDLLTAATPALIGGGVHTPNHRWELSAALARLHLLTPHPALADRIDQWLAEGVDIDADGLYSERSANYAAHVSNPSLLTLAEVAKRPDLVDAVERNLDATLDLLLPDGSVETVMSRRQDQGRSMSLAVYLLPLRRVALLRGRGDLAWAAGLALEQGIAAPADAAARILLDPDIALTLPAPVRPARPRRRVFGAAGLLVDHRPASTTVVFGGSDYPRQGRIRSGLANSPTFLRVFSGAAVLESARLSRTFFGLGPFRGDGLAVQPDTGDSTTVTLRETVSAGYYQPLAPVDQDQHGHYRLGDEGRFSAALDFGRRTRDDVALVTTVRVDLTAAGLELSVEVDGAAVEWALELAFRPGGTMTGARALGGQKWLFPAANSSAAARYRIGGDALTVTMIDASDGRGGPLTAAATDPTYEPGEEYRFLGGTDAATGELLYVTARAPARIRLHISTDTP